MNLRGRIRSALGRPRRDNVDEPDDALSPEAARQLLGSQLTALRQRPGAQIPPNMAERVIAYVGAAGETGWQALAAEPAILDRLDPDAVASAVLRTAFGRYPLPPEIAAVMTERDALRRAAPGDRPGVRQVATARHAGAVRPVTLEPDSDWAVRWARLRYEPAHYTLDPPPEDYPGQVTSLCALRLREDQCLIAWGSTKGTVHLADRNGGRSWDKEMSLGAGTKVTALSPFRLPFSSDILAVGDSGGTVRLWDPVTGRQAGVPFTVAAPVRVLCEFLVEGERALLVTGGNDGFIDTWNPATGRLMTRLNVGTFTGGIISALSVVAGPQDRTLLAVGGDNRMVVVDPVDRVVVTPQNYNFSGPVTAMAAAAASPGCSLVAWSSRYGEHTVWNSASGRTRRPREISGISEIVSLSAAAAGGRNMLAIVGKGPKHLGSPAALAFTPLNDDFLNDDVDETPVLDFEPTHYLDCPTASSAVRLPGWPDLVATGTQDGAVALWDPGATWATPRESVHTKRVRQLQVIPPGAGWSGLGKVLLSGSQDGFVRCWNMENGEEVADPLKMGTAWDLHALDVAGVGTLVACATGSSLVRLYRAGDGEPGRFGLAEWGALPTTHQAVIALCAVTVSGAEPLSLLATGGAEGVVMLWDARTQEEWGDELDLGEAINALCRIPVPGGDLLAIGTNRDTDAVLLWDPATGDVRHLADTPPWVNTVCAIPQPDGRTLLAGGSKNGSLALWDPATGTRLAAPDQWDGVVWALCAPTNATGSTLIASAAESYRVRLWHAATFELVRELDVRTPTFGMTAVGSDLVLATHTGVLVLRLSDNLFSPATSRSGRRTNL